jgi:hypothetical protein
MHVAGQQHPCMHVAGQQHPCMHVAGQRASLQQQAAIASAESEACNRAWWAGALLQLQHRCRASHLQRGRQLCLPAARAPCSVLANRDSKYRDSNCRLLRTGDVKSPKAEMQLPGSAAHSAASKALRAQVSLTRCTPCRRLRVLHLWLHLLVRQLGNQELPGCQQLLLYAVRGQPGVVYQLH